MDKPTARVKRIVRKVLDDLFDRRGFRQEWDGTDQKTKAVIRRSLVTIVQNELDKPEGTKCGN